MNESLPLYIVCLSPSCWPHDAYVSELIMYFVIHNGRGPQEEVLPPFKKAGTEMHSMCTKVPATLPEGVDLGSVAVLPNGA